MHPGEPKLISFDLFDTLVTRNLAHARDIELLLAADPLSPTDFAKRNQTERRLAVNGQSVSIETLYRALISNDQSRNGAIARETELDLKLLQPRPAAVQLLEQYRAAGKRIAVTSDTLYEIKLLREIAGRAGVEPTDLVLSSATERQTKADGRLFQVLIEKSHCAGDQILHIGDNRSADIDNAKSAGLHAQHLLTPLDHYRANRQHASTFARTMAEPTAASSVAIGVIKNRWFDAPANSAYRGDLTQFGYIAYGPLILAIGCWLLATARQRNNAPIFCVSRDGYLIERVLQQLVTWFDENVSAKYLMASRQFSTLVSIASVDELHEHLDARKGTLGQRLNSLLGSTAQKFVDDLLAGAGESKRELSDANAQELVDYAAAQRQAYGANLRSQGLLNGGIVFDIGYQGTTQRALQSIIGQDLYGAYLMTFPEIGTILGDGAKQTHRYLDPARDRRTWDAFQRYRQLHEAILSAPVGSFEGFGEDGSFRHGTMTYAEPLQQIHDGVEMFVTDFLRSWPYGWQQIELSPEFALDHVHTHFASPTDSADIEMFSGIAFADEFAGAPIRTMVVSQTDTALAQSTGLQEQAVWREGQMRLHAPSQNKWLSLVKTVLGVVVSRFTYLTTTKPALRRKLLRDPVLYFADSKSPIIRLLARLYY